MDVIFPPFLSISLTWQSLGCIVTSFFRMATNLIRYQITKNITHDLIFSLTLSLNSRSNINFALRFTYNNLALLHGAREWKAKKNLSGKQFHDILRFIFWLMRFSVFIWVHSLSLFAYLLRKSWKDLWKISFDKNKRKKIIFWCPLKELSFFWLRDFGSFFV